MQIANGMVILSPENHQIKHGVTPAEALILHTMHFLYANGNPLGDFFIQPGEAMTIDAPGKPAEEAYLDHMRREIAAKPAIPAKMHKRTQAEEIERLKRKYTGNITKDGVARPAFEATFGAAIGVRLPETFEDIEPIVGKHFHKKVEDAVRADDNHRANELNKLGRPQLVQMAIDLGVTIHQADGVPYIIAAIINEENKRQQAELQESEGGGAGAGAESDGLEDKTKEELIAIAKELKLEPPSNASKAKLVENIRVARGAGAGAES